LFWDFARNASCVSRNVRISHRTAMWWLAMPIVIHAIAGNRWPLPRLRDRPFARQDRRGPILDSTVQRHACGCRRYAERKWCVVNLCNADLYPYLQWSFFIGRHAPNVHCARIVSRNYMPDQRKHNTNDVVNENQDHSHDKIVVESYLWIIYTCIVKKWDSVNCERPWRRMRFYLQRGNSDKGKGDSQKVGLRDLR